MRHRRVLIPATGFYEWHRPAKGEDGKAQRDGAQVLIGGNETYTSLCRRHWEEETGRWPLAKPKAAGVKVLRATRCAQGRVLPKVGDTLPDSNGLSPVKARVALVLALRKKPVLPRLKDHSALLTAVLLAIAIPPYAPWWIIVIGTAFAIIMVKQLYGGLGNNLFNPAMAAYVLLLVSFPLQMTQWLPPLSLHNTTLTPLDAICSICHRCE